MGRQGAVVKCIIPVRRGMYFVDLHKDCVLTENGQELVRNVLVSRSGRRKHVVTYTDSSLTFHS